MAKRAEAIDFTAPMLRAKAAWAYLGISKSTFYAWQKEGRLPLPVRLSKAVVAWRRSDLDAFLDGCASGGVA